MKQHRRNKYTKGANVCRYKAFAGKRWVCFGRYETKEQARRFIGIFRILLEVPGKKDELVYRRPRQKGGKACRWAVWCEMTPEQEEVYRHSDRMFKALNQKKARRAANR